MEIYLIRHGQSKWQVGKSTSKNSEMTDLGLKQSHYLNQCVKKLIHDSPDETIVYVSPHIRAMQTAEGLQQEFTLEKRLKEASFHVAKKLPKFHTPRLYDRQLSNDVKYNAFRNNIEKILQIIVTQKNYSNVFLYTHGGVIKTILRIIHDNDALCYTIHNCSMTRLTWYRSRWHLSSLNDVSFIPKEFIT